MNKVNSPIKWHGGKYYLCNDLLKIMPPHIHYVEPYFGGGNFLFAKDPEGLSEVVNDIHRGLINFWCVLREERLFKEFQRAVEATAFDESFFNTCKNICEIAAFNPINDRGAVLLAVEFFVACRQSLAGHMKAFAPISRNRTRRGMNEQASAWLTSIEGLPEVHNRLKRVIILNRDALDVIREQDGEQTLFYLDPPYLHETRRSVGQYSYEMSEANHMELLLTCSQIKGKFMLSGYSNNLYEEAANEYGWKVHHFELPNNAAGGESKRRMIECVWTNYEN